MSQPSSAGIPPASETLPPGWTMTTLGEICALNPKLPKKPELNAQVTFVPMAAVCEYTGTIVAPQSKPFSSVSKGYTPFIEGDVLWAKITPCMENGKAAIARDLINGIGVGSTEFFILRSCGTILPQYLHRFVRQETFRAAARKTMNSAVGQARVPKSFLLSAPISLPPLPEQRRIVARLEALEARSHRAREKLAAVPTQLAQARQSLLAAAFRGDLTAEWRAAHKEIDPIENTMKRVRIESSRTGRSASDEEIPGIAGLSVGNIGSLPPRGWIKIPLLNVARLESGHTPSRQHPEYWGGRIPWISIPDARLHHGKIISDTGTFTNELGLANSAARLLPKGTVCLSRTASVGYVTIMGRPMSTSQDFANWICSEALLSEFLMLAFLAEGDHLRSFGRGTTHTTIYYPELKALHILLPSITEQREIVRRLAGAFARLDSAATAHAAAVATLDRLDQSLLARAFSGRLLSAPKGPVDGHGPRSLPRPVAT